MAGCCLMLTGQDNEISWSEVDRKVSGDLAAGSHPSRLADRGDLAPGQRRPLLDPRFPFIPKLLEQRHLAGQRLLPQRPVACSFGLGLVQPPAISANACRKPIPREDDSRKKKERRAIRRA